MFANQKTVPLPFEDEAVVVGVPQNTNWVQVLSLFSTTAGATLLSCKFYKNANEQLGAGLVQLLALARWSDSGRLRHSVVVQAHPPRPAAAEGGGGAARPAAAEGGGVAARPAAAEGGAGAARPAAAEGI